MKEHSNTNSKHRMKFEDIFLDILWEQINQDDPEFDENGDPRDPDALDNGDLGFDDEDNGAVQLDEPVDPDDTEDDKPPQVQPLAPPRQPVQPKKITETQKLKMKWIAEQPGLTDLMMDEHIQFFKERKERLKPYKPYGTIDPATNRHYVNLPEVSAQMERFPDMAPILSDPQRIKDIQNYSWEQISFYVSRILNQNKVIDEENFILGDDNIDQKLQDSYKRWESPNGRIVNEGGITIYKIESKNESIALGSVQRYIHEKYSRTEHNSNPWCISRPPKSHYGSNMYTTYREDYGASFYFLLDRNRPQTDRYHMVAIDVKSPTYRGRETKKPYTIISRMNGDDTNYTWGEIEGMYPQLKGKEQLFKYFGPTRKEQADFTLDMITFQKGDPYDFATLSPQIQNAYIDSKRYVHEIRSFLTLEPAERKLYIDKTVKVDDDYKNRFLCDDTNTPFGILDAIKNTKPQDYKYLDYILKERLNIPQGILAIKLSIVGGNWKRWLSDYESGLTLCSIRGDNNRYNRTTKFGLIDLNTIEDKDESIVKDFSYILTTTKGFMKLEPDDNGVIRRIPYMLQRYARSMGGTNVSANDYFSFLYPKDDILDKKSPNYLKGKYLDGQEAETYMQSRIDSGEFRKI